MNIRDWSSDVCSSDLASDADVGIAHDGDADRMRAVAGDGTYLSGDV